MKKEVFYFHSKIGTLKIVVEGRYLSSLSLVKKPIILKTSNHSLSQYAQKIKKELKAYFSHQRSKFSIPLKTTGTDFQNQVWNQMKKIPYGKTQTYSQIAKAIQRPLATRAVGGACGKNPFLIVVPCHRVVSQSDLGGFSAIGGLKTKKKLLKHEQVF